ncbi:DNA-directed primase/polymerase protein-like isoform X2 [Neocloeon triangulifer]|nr:DNA-directed primase/polymerase protein-like isoform X2 [Neocloeon triangulifer]XP_059486220.1 DNA-directed primase/polymerase protein-like isoform X2 [Neocloeon triangulifer]
MDLREIKFENFDPAKHFETEPVKERVYPSEIAVDLEKEYFKHFAESQERNVLRAALSEESRRWRFFRKQDDLLDCLQHNQHLGVLPFVFHDALRGIRTFVLVHPLELLYRTSKRPLNYFYEIIAADMPSKLYLDLEYDKKTNPNLDGEQMTQTVIDCFLQHMNTKMLLNLNRSMVIQLDSSNDSKFSKHIIFNTFFSFQNNRAVGDLVQEVTQQGQHPELKVLKKDGSPSCIVDLCVYTRNRHFRILGSTKIGRNAPLVLSDSSKAELALPILNETLKMETLFLMSLVSARHCPVLLYSPLTKIDPRIPRRGKASKKSAVTTTQYDLGSGLPNLDAFFEKILKPVGLKKVLSYPGGRIVYSSGPSGFCLNKGTAHQRHRVYWVVIKDLGVFYQKCGDKQDCGNFCSTLQTLPEPLLTQTRGPLDPWEMSLSGPLSKTKLKLINDNEASNILL